MDLSPRQIISPSTSLIPFLEYDDANRALMGKIMIRPEGAKFNLKTYNLRVFERSGQNTIIHYVPRVNFEDAIVISDRVVMDDLLTSVHILEFTAEVLDTRLGPEVVTPEPYKENPSRLKHLDEYGIARIGTKVAPRDILVGKNTPREEKKFSELSPEEKLLMSIFGEKSRPWKNTSLRVPPSVYGTVIGVEILTRNLPDDPIAFGMNDKEGNFIPGELYVDDSVRPPKETP